MDFRMKNSVSSARQLGVPEQPAGIGVCLVGELVKDGGSGQPDVVVIDPPVHYLDEGWVGQDQRSHAPCRQ